MVIHKISRIAAVLVPVAYAVFYAPYGMDTTDFGFFYGYPWRLLQGEMPYRDFYYITPPVSLYWHALWLALTPSSIAVLAGKLSFLAETAAAAWMGTLYLARVFDLKRLGVPSALLATLGFVWGVHSFPPMPWHTMDGVFFGSAALFAGISGFPLLAGVSAALSMLTKQSYLFVPVAVFAVVFCCRPGKREALFCLLGTILVLLLHYVSLQYMGAWEAFRSLTTGRLDFDEALKAGIFIYITQNWYLPGAALIPHCMGRLSKKTIPALLQPLPLYSLILACVYIYDVLSQKGWIGFGDSWPTLFMVLGGICVLFPAVFLSGCMKNTEEKYRVSPSARASVALAAALALSWSTAISGGYKIPAFFALPLLFSALLVHARLAPRAAGPEAAPGKVRAAAGLLLICGLVMFRAGYEYPYVFPVRPMPRSSLVHDAGHIYPKANHVYVDEEMYAKLRELRALRERYGPNYKTLPGFPLAYFLNGDAPVYPSEWVMDWWIGGEVERAYQVLVDRDIVVFMERDQMDVDSPDGYASRRYSVPAKVTKLWRRVEETEHFVVLKKPE